MKSKAKEKAMKYLKDKQMMDIEEGDIPLSKRDCSKAIDIAIQETKKEMMEEFLKEFQPLIKDAKLILGESLEVIL